MKNTSLIGKFFLVSNHEDNQYRIGRIIGQAFPPHLSLLLQFDPVDDLTIKSVPVPQEAYGIDELLTCCKDCGTKLWEFFDSAEARTRYLGYVNAPDEKSTTPAIVHLKDHPKRKGP